MGEEVLARWSDEGWYYRGNKTLVVFFGSVRIFSCVHGVRGRGKSRV